MEELNFGKATEATQEGRLIARRGWNGKNMFVFLRPADELSVDFIVNNIKSLPKPLKDYYKDSEGSTRVKFSAYLCLKAADGTIVNGWTASQSDILATDWYVLD